MDFPKIGGHPDKAEKSVLEVHNGKVTKELYEGLQVRTRKVGDREWSYLTRGRKASGYQSKLDSSMEGTHGSRW